MVSFYKLYKHAYPPIGQWCARESFLECLVPQVTHIQIYRCAVPEVSGFPDLTGRKYFVLIMSLWSTISMVSAGAEVTEVGATSSLAGEEHAHLLAVVPYFKNSSTWPSSERNTVLFYRDEVKALMSGLSDFVSSKASLAIVEGSPGVGKSLTTWKWAMDCVVDHGVEHIVWHSVSLSRVMSLRMVNGSLQVQAGNAHIADTLGNVDNDALIILDDITEKDFQARRSEIAISVQRRSVRIILISSGDINVPNEWRTVFGCQRLTVNPWSLDEYLAATSEPEFLRQCIMNFEGDPQLVDALRAPRPLQGEKKSALESVRALVTAKYYIAGSNARWMFEYATELTLQEIGHSFAMTTSTAAILHGLFGCRSEISVNCLCARFWDRGQGRLVSSELVSAFVSRQLPLRCVPAEIARATIFAEACHNSRLDAQILEVDVLQSITNRTLQRRVVRRGGAVPDEATYAVRTIIGFRDTMELVGASLSPGTWFIPEQRYHPAGYDAVCLYQRAGRTRHSACRVMRFVHVARSHRRDVNLQSMDKFLTNFNQDRSQNDRVTEVEVVLLVPHDMLDSSVRAFTRIDATIAQHRLCPFTIGEIQTVGFRRANYPDL